MIDDAISKAIDEVPSAVAKLVRGVNAVDVAMKRATIVAGELRLCLCPKHHAQLLRLFGPWPRLRAQAIAKARGKNWRHVR